MPDDFDARVIAQNHIFASGLRADLAHVSMLITLWERDSVTALDQVLGEKISNYVQHLMLMKDYLKQMVEYAEEA